MKYLLRTLILLLLATNVHAQCIQLKKLHGDTVYGTLHVEDTTSGLTTGGGSPGCSLPVTAFRTITGTYHFHFSKPVFNIRVDLYGMDEMENISVKVNGIAHPIQPSEMLAYTNCGSTGNPPITLTGGILYAPVGVGAFNGGSFDLVTCNGFDSFEVDGYSLGTGVSFDLCVDTVRPNYCLFANANTPLCVGDDLHLFATGDSAGGTATYVWYGPGSYTAPGKRVTIPKVTLADAGKYHVVRTVGTVTDTDTISIVVRPYPIISPTSNSPICYPGGNVIDLNATFTSTPDVIIWRGPNSFSSSTAHNVITPVVDADTGIYTIIAGLNGCVDSDHVHVVYAPVPSAPVILGPTLYCAGETFVPFYFSSGTGGVLWYPVPVGGTGTSTAPVVNTAVPGVTTVYATQTVLGCESLRGSATVTVKPTPPAPTITGTNAYCQFDGYVPPVATGTAVLWYTTPAGGVGSSVTPTVSTATPGTISLYATQTVGGCESPRALFSITIHSRPGLPLVIDDPNIYCTNQVFVPFTIVSGINLLWYPTPVGGTSSGVAPALSTATAGVQTVYVTQTVAGCESARFPVSVTVIASVKAQFDYKVNYGCKADTIVFTNTSLNTTTYTWKFGDGFSSSATDPTHIYLVQAIDSVKLESSIGSCADSVTVGIDLRHPLHAAFDIDTNLICQNGLVNFTDTLSIGTAGFTRLWSYGDYVLHPPVTTATTKHNYPVAGVFNAYLVITDPYNCTDTAFKTIYVDSSGPITMALTDTVICLGSYITATGSLTTIGLTKLLWDMGNNDSVAMENPLVYAYQTSGQFTITEHAYYRVCPNTSTTHIINVVPQPTISIGSDATICKGSESLTLSDGINAGNAAATWLWNTGETTPAITVVAPGVYTATVRVHGCYASATVTINNDCYLNIPNVFTPDNDGTNDYFYPHQYLSSGLSSFRMDIFNRWGVKVFETTSLDGRGWDGKLNGVDQPEGVYIYTVDAAFKDGQHERHQGNVTLLR